MRHKPLKRKKRAPTLPALKKKAWKLLSELVRRSDTFGGSGTQTCYTCGYNIHWTGMQAGHAIGGRTGAVLLDEEIIRPQCYRCNVALRGNYPVFVTKLIREKAEQLGGEYPLDTALQWWEAKLQASRQVKKWNRSDLEGKIADYRARLEALKTSI